MLDGLLGRGSSFKCKSLIKATRTRIEVIRRRAEAKQRFLKEDLAKLLSNGLDINAYGRTEEFLTGMNLLSCYDFIELSCEYIVKQLSRLEKQRDCPEECREAVASLMFAAARFSDLPELRDLRDIFQQKYGNCLEAFVNQKFLEKLSSKPPAPARKLQVLHDITSEFSIKWDSKGFEQRMGTPSICAQVEVQKADMVKQRHGLLDAKSRIQGSGEGNVVRRDNSDDHTTGRQEIVEHSHRRQKSTLKQGESSSQGDDFSFHGRQTLTGNKNSYPIEKYDEELKPAGTKYSSHGKIPDNVRVGYMRDSNGISIPRKGENSEALTGNKHSYPMAKGDVEFKPARSSSLSHKKMPDNVHVGYMRPNNLGTGESSEALTCEKGESAPGFVQHMGEIGAVGSDEYVNQIDTIKSIQRGLEKESDRSKPYSIYALPPPYVKASRVSKHVGSDCDEHSFNQSSCNRSNAVNSSGRTYSEPDHHDHEQQYIAPAKVKGYGHELELDYQDDKIFLPKPRSIRRKHHKSSSGYDVGSGEDVGTVKRSSNSRRKDHSRKGLQIMFDEEHHRNDDEERIIDKLLIHYSKKPSSYDEEKLRNKLPAGSARQIIADAGESSLYQSKDPLDVKSGVAPPPARSVSLPREQIASQELKKSFARSNTFQPDNQARHVHPKLPDYDDLAARFAALKGR